MKAIRKFISFVYDFISDPDNDPKERVFVTYSLLSELALIIAIIGDIYIGEYIQEIALLVGVVIVVPLVTFVSLYMNKLRFAITFLIFGLIFFIVPGIFFFGGGLRGGGVIWIIFAFMYIGLVASGSLRRVTLTLLVVISAICFGVAYYNPDWIAPHSQYEAFVDFYISVLLVGLVCFLMTWYQNKLFEEENVRAKNEAERAEELTRSQNRFFSSMSHEIRTPINSILGLNELILRDNNATDEIINDASGIQGSGKMLLALINDILDFSKIEAGSMDIVPVDYNVGNMLSEIVNMIWLRATDKGLRFDVKVDPKVPSVLYGDEVRIKQIIINLLNNAVKYTKEGSIELSLESEPADDDNVMITISVSDTGMGIKKEALPNLFDAFKRVDEEKNRNIEGTGLGLSIVRQLVDLMGGTITVNSVYGEGSTFTVVVKQGVSDKKEIGELNIHNQKSASRSEYEPSFTAPEACILIVDDNDLNLEVESKLLSGTKMLIDKALNGKIALEKCLEKHYDVILMDHLMPEMDGIECLDAIRIQTGGLNKTTPVIVLTANAGSENRELYRLAGFDGYLVKPVSGESIENILIKHIPKEKLLISSKMANMREDINTLSGYAGKSPVVITSTSMCDIPDNVIKKLNIPILPFMVKTEKGVFKDSVQMDAYELIRYLNAGNEADSYPPDEAAYTAFFSNVLRKTHHVIHIAITTSVSRDYEIACEAAKAFDNVTVINSECLSSATGILVLIAHKLAQQNIPVPEIITELENVRKRLRCSFIIDTTDYMARRGFISESVHKIAKNLYLHPALNVKDDKSTIAGVWIGGKKRSYQKYIQKAFPVDIIPDPDVVFITYADVPIDTLLWVREEISKYAYFEHVIFKQASAAISSNCGPGSFGILYFIKSNKSYNIGSYLSDEAKSYEDSDITKEEYDSTYESIEEVIEDIAEEEDEFIEDENEIEENNVKDKKWYDVLKNIDVNAAMENSGGEDGFKTVLKMYYESIDDKASEIEGYYSSNDIENYTIKVHALKSSSRIIGALDLGERAQKLEDAGKAKDEAYIKENHASFMEDYRKMKDIIGPVFKEKNDKPVADEFLISSVYEGIREAAEAMDADTIEEILKELEDYSIPENEAEKYKAVTEKAGIFDYDGIIEVLDKM